MGNKSIFTTLKESVLFVVCLYNFSVVNSVLFPRISRMNSNKWDRNPVIQSNGGNKNISMSARSYLLNHMVDVLFKVT